MMTQEKLEITYLGQPLVRDALRIFLGEDATILPLPSDEAACEFLRGQPLILVPLSDKDRTIRSAAAMLRLANIPCSVSPVSAEWFLATMPPDKDRLKKLLAGVANHTQEKHPHLSQENTSCSFLTGYKRVDFPMVLDGLLPAGVVGGINAEGGTGKTYFLISLFCAIATGMTWGPFAPRRPQKVLLLLAEDPLDIVRNRIFDIASEIIPQDLRHLLLENFHATSIRGISGPLMRLEGGNAAPTEWMEWLDATLEAHPGTEVLGLDPLRKFFGLDENKNEFAHAFIGLMESATIRHNLTALYSHHVAKAQRGAEVSQITGRGAGGLSDNCRWMASMRPLDPTTFANLELDGSPNEYVEFAITKSNYAPKLPEPIYFKRGLHGVLSPLPARRNKMDIQAEYLADLIANQEYSRREIEKSVIGKDVREAMKERFTGWKRTDFDKTVKHAIQGGWMNEIESSTGHTGRPKLILEKIQQSGF